MNTQATPYRVAMCNGLEFDGPDHERQHHDILTKHVEEAVRLLAMGVEPLEPCLAHTHTFVTSRTMADLCDMAAHLFHGVEYDLFTLVTCANGTSARIDMTFVECPCGKTDVNLFAYTGFYRQGHLSTSDPAVADRLAHHYTSAGAYCLYGGVLVQDARRHADLIIAAAKNKTTK